MYPSHSKRFIIKYTELWKNLLLSYCGFEIEMKGIPDKFKKEIETLIWDFIRERKVNQIKRDVCCLDIENGGMSMVNLDSYIDSRRTKFIYRIINEPIENWNAIGKYWLSRLDLKNFFDANFAMSLDS